MFVQLNSKVEQVGLRGYLRLACRQSENVHLTCLRGTETTVLRVGIRSKIDRHAEACAIYGNLLVVQNRILLQLTSESSIGSDWQDSGGQNDFCF